jgi:hypothetical protein
MAVLVFEGESPEDLRNRRVKLNLMTKSKEKVQGNATNGFQGSNTITEGTHQQYYYHYPWQK